MKKIRFILPLSALLLCLLFSACKKDGNNLHFAYDGPCHCGVDNPLEELEWLNKVVLKMESMRGKMHSSIYTCTYNSGQNGFLVNYDEMVCDGFTGFYDCEGTLLCSIGGIAGNTCPEYSIDDSSTRKIYCNYVDTVATIFNKVWRIVHFVDRDNDNGWTYEVPMQGNSPIPFWLRFGDDWQVSGGGINRLDGVYYIEDYNIRINIQATTEIYDATGWEDRLVAALNTTTEYSLLSEGRILRIYYDLNRKFIDFALVER